MHCLNCGALNPPSKGNKSRKYCSRKCADQYYSKEGRYYKKKNKDWGKATSKTEKRRAKQKKEFLYAKKHYITKEEAAETLGITLASIWHRAKKANIESIIAYKDGRQVTFYKPEDLDKLVYSEPTIPEGYVTADKAAEYIGVKVSSFWTMGTTRGRKRPKPSIVQWGVGAHNTRRNLYALKDLDLWMAEGIAIQKERAEASRLRKIQREKDEKERMRMIEEKTRGMMNIEAAMSFLGVKSRHVLKNTPYEKINGLVWYDPKDVHKLGLKRENERLEREANRMRTCKNNVPLRENAGTDEAYESQRKQRARCGPPDYVHRDKKAFKAWESHAEPWRIEEEEGRIVELKCSKCEQTLPYTRFYIHFRNSGADRWARSKICKSCTKETAKWKSNLKRGKRKRPKTRGRMASQIGLSIQRDLSKRNKKYYAMNHKLMWKQIKTYVGYTKDELLDYIESKFKPWMSWENNGRPSNPANPTWQLDHIKPKSSFEYTSIADPEFAKCWALENLQPLESRLNLLKSNKTLRSRFSSSFNNGIKSKKILRSGIWAHLPYTNLEAKKYFENLFEDGMTWDNWGDAWHIDHLVPQAYLSYTDVEEKNFRYCWALENLKPTPRSKNCAKNSRYKNKLWFYNDV